MAITTYAELKTAIPNWFRDRQDLAAQTDEFIDLAEALLNSKLRCRQMETVASLTPTNNVCTLPTDYVEYKRVVEEASIRRKLAYITEDAADGLYPSRYSGLACHFMIVGSSLTALPLSANNIELTYYQKLPALSDSNTTNWLLTEHPGLYLHACLMYAAEYVSDGLNVDDIARESKWVETYLGTISEVDNRGKFGNAGVVLQGITP